MDADAAEGTEDTSFGDSGLDDSGLDDSGLETVAVYSLRHEAEVAKAVLASAGIEALVIADDEGGLNPGFFSRYGVRVVVRGGEAPRARNLLDEQSR